MSFHQARADDVAKSARGRLSRLEILSTLRSYAKLSNPPLLNKPADVAPWWTAGSDDLLLVRGVLTHGFGHWARIFKDESLFSPPPAKMPGKSELLHRLKSICDATNASAHARKPPGSSAAKPAAKSIPAILKAKVVLPELPKPCPPTPPKQAGKAKGHPSSESANSLCQDTREAVPLDTLGSQEPKQCAAEGSTAPPSMEGKVCVAEGRPAAAGESSDDDDVPLAMRVAGQ